MAGVSKQVFRALLLILGFAGAVAFGAVDIPSPDLPEMQIEANTSVEDDGATNEYVWFAGLAAFLVVLGVWSSLSRAIGTRGADNLFLGFRVTTEGGEQQVYLRALDLSRAEFVSPKPMSRGLSVRLNFGSLPDYPVPEHAEIQDHPAWIDGEVTRCRLMKGGESYLVRVRMPLPPSQKRPLARYLEALSGGSRLSHA